MLYDATRAFSQLFTPPFRRLLFKCVGLSLILLVVSGFALDRVLQAFVSTPYPWLDTAIAVAAALGIVAAAIFLTPPVTIIVAGLYLDEIADLVEQRYYPDDPPGTPQPLIRSIWLSVVFFLVVLAVNLVALMLLLVPGLNLVAFFLANAYLLGREYFELAAMRFRSAEAAKAMRRDNAVHDLRRGLHRRGRRLDPDPEPGDAALRRRLHGASAQEAVAAGAGRPPAH